MELSYAHFFYDDIPSRKYNLIFARVETERNRIIRGRTSGLYVNNRANNVRYLNGDDYSESHISMDVEIITDRDEGIERNNLREIQRWLFGDNRFKMMYIDPNDDIFGDTYDIVDGERKHLYLNCRFTNPEVIEYYNGVVGFKCTLEADSDMWWQDEITYCLYDKDVDNVEGLEIFEGEKFFNVDTDSAGYTYPVIQVQADFIEEGYGTMTMTNLTDTYGTEPFSLTNIEGGYSVYADCETGIISSAQDITFSDVMNSVKFARLLQGYNHIAFTCENIRGIWITWRNKRFL